MAVGSSNDFDLVVLGAGTGGYAAAFRASQLGLKVALVDEDKLGGTCLHRGCIPTKALLESAAFAERLRHAADFGLNLPGEATIDYAQMAKRRDQVVTRMWKGVQTLVKKYDVTWIQGRGRLDGAHKVRVQMAGDDGTPGARRRARPQRDGRHPRHRLAGEVAARRRARRQADRDLGRRPHDGHAARERHRDRGGRGRASSSRRCTTTSASTVTVLEYLPAIVPLEDRDVSKELERSFSRRGIKVMTNARFDAEVGQGRGTTACKLTVGPEGKDASEIEAEILLVAAGRATNVEDVGLDTTSAEVDRGIVKVDGHMRTKEPHLYAIGDIVGGLMLAHTAAHEGITAAHTIAGDPDVHPMDYVMQPRATYCRPEIASVGLTEQQCEERGLPIKVAKVPFQAIAKAIIGGEYEGFAKVIGNKETEDTLGIHIIGPHATDLIAEASLALYLDATPWEIGASTHAHPTFSEILGETAMAVDGRSINF